ncbi:hypothetical protein Tco_1577605 [Tanacetum coccineum]
MLLTRIGDEIYSTVDACKTAHDTWIAIERLQQGESLNIQDAKTNLFWEFGKFTYHNGETMESYYSRFYKMMNEMIRNNLTIATMQVNYQKEVNEIPPKSHKSYAPPSKQSSSTRSNASTKYKGKEIAKPITPPSESAFEEDSDPEQAQRDKEMQKILALIAKYFKKIYKPTNKNLRTSSNTRNKNVDTSPRSAGNQKRVKDYTYHKEKILLYKQAKEGVPLQAEQVDWLEDTDEDVDEQELEAHYRFMAKIQEVLPADLGTNAEPLEKWKKVDRNVIPDSPDMCDNDDQVDQNAEECDDERAALANLIANLTLDTEENKNILKQLKKANTSLSQELKECKSTLEETRALGESNSTRDSCLIAFQNQKIELEKHKTYLNRLENDKLELEPWQKHVKDRFHVPTAKDMSSLVEVCLMPLAIKTQNDSFKFVHELKQEMFTDLEYIKSLEKEIDELESDKANFSNTYDLLLQECVSKDVMCSYLHSLPDLTAQAELQCLYVHKVKECECLAQKLSKQTETVSKEVYNELSRSFAKLEKHSISLELALQQCQEQMKNDTDSKTSVLGKLAPFSDSLERKSFSQTKSVLKTNVSESLSKPVTTQILPQTAKQAVRNTNVIKPGMYQIDTRTTQTRAPQLPQTSRNTNPYVSTSTGVIHKTNVSRPQLRSTQMKDKVVPNNSQVKDKKIEDPICQVFHRPLISLYCDSQSAIAISCNPVQHSHTKHIHTRYHFIKEQVENGIIELYFVRTEYQLADMFNKALPEDRFQYLVRRIGMRCLTPAELEVLTNESA